MNLQNPLRKFAKASSSVVLLGLALLLLSSSVFAQVTASSALSGTVTDKNGALAQDLFLDVALPTGLEYVSASTDRGSGCAAT